MKTLLDETIGIALAAGKAIMAFYQDSFSVRDKTPDNPVTDADLAADALLRDQLRRLLPEAGWLSEETADSPQRLQRDLVWVVDPLDGTKEFVLGIPEFAVSIALVEETTPRLAVVHNPVSGELYSANKGYGAFLDGRPIAVTATNELTLARVDASRSERGRGEFEPFDGLVTLKTMGSIAYKLARVAAGRADATWSRGPKNEWDICAGALLVEEAGGRCTDLDGLPFRFNRAVPRVSGIIATNAPLFEQVTALLGPHRHTARTD
jgi:myo-inositol-1(or 4)-monophosphatase